MLRQLTLSVLSFALTVLSLNGESLLPDRVLTINLPTEPFQSIPTFQNGYFAIHDGPPVLVPQVYLYNSSGTQLMQTKIPITGTYREIIKDVSISPAGTVAVTGTAFTGDGAQARFLAWIDSSGAVQRIVRTSPFSADRICFAPDGSLWAAGMQSTPDLKDEADDYDTLRHYDATGHLLQSVLSRSSFIRAPAHNFLGPGVYGYLMAAPDHIAFYTPAAFEWDEISNSGSVLLRTPALNAVALGLTRPNTPVGATGAAVLSSGRAYISAQERDSPTAQYAVLYRFDTTTGNWQAVDTSAVPGRKLWRVVGSDGDELVITVGSGQMWWAKVQ